jgi:RsiW-degrading membrane proteinase PrsW (M82 family)
MNPLQWLARGDLGTVRVGRTTCPARLLVTAAGIALWLGLMIAETGNGGITAIWTNLLFLVPLALACSRTRTVSTRQLVSFCLFGGFMMGCALVVINAVAPESTIRSFIVPPIEETAKIAPVLFVLWRWRKSRIWTLAVTDVLLMAAASGTGFAVVEDAYIRSRFGWQGQWSWLPVTEFAGGRIIAGHAIWTALAGLMIGLGLLLRRIPPLAIAVGASGYLLSLLDHISNNYDATAGGGTAMDAIVHHGYLVLWVFLIGVPLALAADWLIGQTAIPDLPELRQPGVLANARARQAYDVRMRQLAHALYHSRQSSGLTRARAIGTAAALDAWFQSKRLAMEPAASPD